MTGSRVEDATAQHVRRTLRALELLAEAPRTQADLAHALDIHRRTARRLLARLVEEGYAEEAQRSRHVAYRATPRLTVLGRKVAEGLDLIAIGRRHLARLDPARAGTRFLAALEPDGVRLLEVQEPTGAGDRAPTELAPRGGPLHATAAGKVFLSADTALLGEVLNHELLAYTARTLVTRADLLLELATARERGYAVEQEEHRAGVRTVASPVVDHGGHVVAAIGAAPAADVAVDELGPLVREAAVEYSREIGAGLYD
jgi:DNA-binding IclR family transcriptional regulator